MMSKYEVEIQETKEGELYFQIPQELLDKLGWKEGDDLKFIEKGNRLIQIKKMRYESVELDFTEEELYKYMLAAHESKMSFDEWVEMALSAWLKSDDSDEPNNNLYEKLKNS